MATFEMAIPVLLNHEGGIADIGDGQGVTCFGWTKQTCTRMGIAQPQTPDAAGQLYRTHFWLPLYEQITSQTVATKLFDDAVNQGPAEAHKSVQQALIAAGCTVTVDGTFGPNTVAAVNHVPEALLLPWMRKMQYASYDTWVRANYPARHKFQRGLARRAAWPDATGTIAQALLENTYLSGETDAKTS